MATAPYSGSILILQENQDGIDVVVYHWDNIAEGVPIPPSGPVINNLVNSIPAHTFHAHRMATTRADLIAKFTAYVNAKFPDTQ